MLDTNKTTKVPFVSPFIVPPGETLGEKISEMGMNVEDFADKAGMSVEALIQLLKGRLPLSPNIAAKLEETTAIPADYWNRAEANYREKLEKLGTE